ncbi:MAG TPA: ATP-binding protein [Planctomycetes bacterium]|nr:ATP-binding protein [Planctomycetota bacterium]
MDQLVFDTIFCRAVIQWERGYRAQAAVLMDSLDPTRVRQRLENPSGLGTEAPRVAREILEESGRSTRDREEVTVTPPPHPKGFHLDNPDPLLQYLAHPNSDPMRLDAISSPEIWGLVALAALAHDERENPFDVAPHGLTKPERFANAVGFFQVIGRESSILPEQRSRTVKLTRIDDYRQVETAAKRVSQLLVPEQSDMEDVRKMVFYVVVELLRNVLQHSMDDIGAILAAQRMNRPGEERTSFQIAVADAGIGIHASLAEEHPDIETAGEAIQEAIRPHFSGTFAEGFTGGSQNAGMGLFFIDEMAKRTGGRLLIASRGASVLSTGDPEFKRNHSISKRPPYPGTLVVFELPVFEDLSYDGLIHVIQNKAMEQMPSRVSENWIRFEDPPEHAFRCMVNVAAENTAAAEEFARKTILPRIVDRTPVALDFRNLTICTQSFAHSLLFEALRVAWALKVPLYVQHARPMVKSSLELVQNYALRG